MLKLLLILTGKPYLNLVSMARCYKPGSKSFRFNLSSKEHPGVEQQKGQSLLELAIFLPVLFILLLAMIYTGLCLDHKMKLEAIAREATRVVAKNTGNGSVSIGLARAEVVARQYGLDPAALEIKVYGTYVSDSFTPGRGSMVTAEVTNTLKLFGFVAVTIGGKHSEIIECWRTRDDANSGGSCLPPDQQAE
jgi:Flp pilus assembly protein TadG